MILGTPEEQKIQPDGKMPPNIKKEHRKAKQRQRQVFFGAPPPFTLDPSSPHRPDGETLSP